MIRHTHPPGVCQQIAISCNAMNFPFVSEVCSNALFILFVLFIIITLYIIARKEAQQLIMHILMYFVVNDLHIEDTYCVTALACMYIV